jgi:hypothetical protein
MQGMEDRHPRYLNPGTEENRSADALCIKIKKGSSVKILDHIWHILNCVNLNKQELLIETDCSVV